MRRISASGDVCDPQCESPIEDILSWQFVKHLKPGIEVKKQHWIKTICGNFRVDFLVVGSDGSKVIYECDGRDFHKGDYDEWRDAMILGANACDSLIRLRGSDLYHQTGDVMYWLMQFNPRFFKERSREAASNLASNEALEHEPSSSSHVYYTIKRQDYESDPVREFQFWIKKQSRKPSGREFWQRRFEFAAKSKLHRLEDVIALWNARRFV